MTLRYLSLFSGIGGFEIASEIANQQIGCKAFEVAALCEQNEFCQKVLNCHYPSIPLLPDVRNISVDVIREFGRIDGIVGGFPCQDVSNSGKRAGLNGERSGLFYEIIRLVRLVRPRFVYLENVAALVGRGLREVLGEFAELRYDAEWSVIPCSDLGGSHRRERFWIIAHDQSVRCGTRYGGNKALPREDNLSPTTHPNGAGLEARQRKSALQRQVPQPEQRNSVFHWQEAAESLVRSCHDGIPFGLGDGSAYLLRLADVPACLEYAADTLPLAHRKEALQAYGNAIAPQVGAIGFMKVYSLMQENAK